MRACLPDRYSAAAADPAEGRTDRRGGVSHQRRICQPVGTSGRPGKRRYSLSRRSPHASVPIKAARAFGKAIGVKDPI